MTRVLGQSLLNQIGLAHGIRAYLLELAFSGGTTRITDAPMDLLWNAQTWQALGGELVVDAAGESMDERSQGLGLRVSGVSQTLIAQILGQKYRGRQATLYYAHLAINMNLCSNGDFETNTLGVTVLGSSVARVTTYAKTGRASCKVTTTNVSGSGARFGDQNASDRFAVSQGVPYIAQAQVAVDPAAGASKSIDIEIQWFDSGGVALSITGTNTYSVPATGEFVKLVSQSVVPPASAVSATVRIDTNGAQGVFDFYVDSVQAEVGATEGLFQSTDSAKLLEGAVIGTPYTLFKGYMNDTFRIEETPSTPSGQGTCTISTRLSSRLADLARVRGLRTNLESHQALFSGETFFQNIPGIMGRRIYWGVDDPTLSRAAPSGSNGPVMGNPNTNPWNGGHGPGGIG